MPWVHKLFDRTSWMANPAGIDVVDNTLWLAHCTVPRGMAEEYRLRSHFESDLGVGIQGKLPTGPVTLVRIGGRSLEKLWLVEGEILPTDHAENLCRTQVKVRLTQGQVRDLLITPLGNHLVLVRGHHARHLRAWREMMIVPGSQ
jgi:L-fucose isomerase-like protein